MKNNLTNLFLLILIVVLLLICKRIFIFDDNVLYEMASLIYDHKTAVNYIYSIKQVEIIGIVIYVIKVLLQVTFITLILKTGTYIKSTNVSLSKCFKVSIFASYSIVIYIITTILYYYIQFEFLNNFEYFNPFTLASYIPNIDEIYWLKKILTLFNLGTIIFLIMATLGWYKYTENNFKESFKFIMHVFGFTIIILETFNLLLII